MAVDQDEHANMMRAALVQASPTAACRKCLLLWQSAQGWNHEAFVRFECRLSVRSNGRKFLLGERH